MQPTLTGGCLCGAVRYEIEGSLRHVTHCHCGMCRKAHGAAFATYASLARRRFHLKSGERALRAFRSSASVTREFCGTCGSSLFWSDGEHPDAIGIALGTLDGDPGGRPEAHIYAKDRAPWDEITDALPRFDGGLPADAVPVPVPIIRTFRGLYDTGNSRPDPRGLASRFPGIRPRSDDRVRYTTGECVIRDKGGLDRFIDRVPRRKMEHVPHPEPSDDPILERPDIDFDNDMVLAIISHEPNRFVGVGIEAVEVMAGTMRVLCHYSEPGPVVQKIISYGSYCAVVVRRFDADIVFAGT